MFAIQKGQDKRDIRYCLSSSEQLITLIVHAQEFTLVHYVKNGFINPNHIWVKYSFFIEGRGQVEPSLCLALIIGKTKMAEMSNLQIW